jgi:GNAT superfamily N-acetyltransferase
MMSTVRRLEEGDIAAYIALRREALGDSPWAFSASVEDDRGLDPQGVQEALGGRWSCIVGAFDGGQLVSIAGAMREAKLKRAHIARIWGVYTSPSARGKGIGRAVVKRTMDEALSWEGVEVIQLSVSEGSPARKIYESLGFVAWGLESNALKIRGETRREVHMEQYFSSAR